MARCEDFPCCGHEAGCCPDFDEETGEQLNMVCTCGAKLPVNARYSICDGCMRRARIEDGGYDDGPEFDDDDLDDEEGDDDDDGGDEGDSDFGYEDEP